MSARHTSRLLLTALLVGVFLGGADHSCIPEPTAAGSAPKAGWLSAPPEQPSGPDVDCRACLLTLLSRAVATDSDLPPSMLPDLPEMPGRPSESPRPQATLPVPPGRAPPLLG